ncbi:MAG: HAD-IA family hydrolase [Candidatus Moranbacteria bacterium]|nr:HAD-IA family hydrolase [Candidatus Moranbacteria bacterium]
MENKSKRGRGKIEAVIFDFDGTLADSFHLFIKAVNSIREKEREKPLGKKEIEQLRNMEAREILTQLGLSMWKIPLYAKRARDYMNKNFRGVFPFQGTEIMLKQLKNNNIRLILLTSNKKDSVESFFKKCDWSKFDLLVAGAGPFSKSREVRKIIKKMRLDPKKTILIGDETRDIEGAKKAGICSGAVAWGYNGKEILLKKDPDYMFNDPSEIAQKLINDNEKQ